MISRCCGRSKCAATGTSDERTMRRLYMIVLALAVVLPAAGSAAEQPKENPPQRRALAPPPIRPAHPNPPAFERLNRMSPEQRQKVLDRLPPERRKKVEEQLDRFNKLSPEEKSKLQQQYEAFRQLPPERQESVRRTWRDFNSLPEDRRIAVRQEIGRMRRLTPSERKARIDSEAFRGMYSANEQQVIANMADLIPNQN